MHSKSFLIKVFHALFSVLPDKALCIFGNCKSACSHLALEDDVNDIKSKKLKLHLSLCRKCWNYSHQMQFINKEIKDSISDNIDQHAEAELKKRSAQLATSIVDKISKN